jgi:manganese/zinc/iron transport system permease protein
MVSTLLGADGKSLPVLLLGATVTGLLGVGTILLIRNLTRLKEDTALGIVLSVFFGAGAAMMGVVQQMKGGHAAGLEGFITGKTASMIARDAELIGVAALISIGACLLLFKELKLLCFDEGFAGSRGLPVVRLDLALMGLVVIVTIVGLQAVGLVLMIALLVIPAAAARFWTEDMRGMAIISSLLGAVGGMLGSALSGLFSRLPSGAMIVLVCAAFFGISMVFGTARGILVRLVRRTRLNRAIDRQHLLRALYEAAEVAGPRGGEPYPQAISVSVRDLLDRRSWSASRLDRTIRQAERAQLVVRLEDDVRLTAQGLTEAARLTRQHRLWELYLITHADIAPSKVDRDADAIEHVLEPDIVAELEALLIRSYPDIPASPHELRTAGGRLPH